MSVRTGGKQTMHKRIGILTFHRALNYGAVLQAYALAHHLNQLGFSAEIIDYVPSRQAEVTAFLVPPKNQTAIYRDAASLYCVKYLKGREKAFQQFQNDHIHISSERNIRNNQLLDILKEYDAIICGSDQVWNPRLRSSEKAFFLPEGENFIRISYAASMGTGRLNEYPNPAFIRKCLQRFDYISVRDQSSIKKLNDFCVLQQPVFRVVDPTLLLKPSDFDSIALPNSKEEPYIFYYTVPGRKTTIQAANYLSKRTKLPLKTLLTGIPAKFWLTNKKNVVMDQPGPDRFLSLIRDAEYVVTDSFHAAVFSILFHKKFYIIGAETNDGKLRHDERLSDLCQTFHLSHRIIQASEIRNIQIDAEEDWPTIDALREAHSAFSDSFLQKAIQGETITLPSEDNQSTDAFSPPSPRQDRICPTDQCTSCWACVNSCHFGAIVKTSMDDGRVLPTIDLDKCVHCNACRNVCPQLHPPVFNENQACYAAQWKNSDRIRSSSAGIGIALMQHILQQEGVVFGAGIDADLVVRHYCAETIEDAQRMRTSKYVFSDMGTIHQQIKEKLAQGKRVLFIGTPCQVASVKNFIHGSTDLLFCVDLVCHGMPPMAYLLQHFSGKAIAAQRYSFRGGERDLVLKAWHNEKLIYCKPWWHDEYYWCFMGFITLAEGCYSCPYATSTRVGDLTIGDFWKLDRSSLTVPMEGRISLVLINTAHGQKLWREIKDDLVFEERSLSEAIVGNHNLQRPTPVPGIRRHFLDRYKASGDFSKAFHSSKIIRRYQIDGIKKSKPVRLLAKVKKHIIHK